MTLYLKALHIIFIVTWFAGLFYSVRLFVYHAEALEADDTQREVLVPQYKLMQRRLWLGITWPSAVVTLAFGLGLLGQMPTLARMGFMHAKFALVLALYAYHLRCHALFRQFQKDTATISSHALRVWNEVATLLLVGIVFLIVLKDALNAVWGTLGFILLSVVLMASIVAYRRLRTGRPGQQ